MRLSERPYIIAEAGSCHEEDFSRADVLIMEAQKAGAQAIKFQYWSDPGLMRLRRGVDGAAYDKGSIKPEWIPRLKDLAHGRGLDFICTVYLPCDVPTLKPHVDAFKVSSFEAADEELISAIPKNKRTFVSTGLGLGDLHVDRIIESLPRAYILHCVSAYPCPIEEAGLGVIYGCYDGYSDHTRCVLTGGFAVSAGADFLEVHFRLDDTSETCPDFVVSLTPDELAQYIKGAQAAYKMRGNGVKKVQPSEKPNLRYRVGG